MNTFGERLLAALKHKGMSQRELAKRIGVSPQNVNFLCKQGQGSNKTSQIASILGINPKWLETGKGDMLLGATHDPVQARFMQIIRSAQAAIDDSGKELTEDQIVHFYRMAIDFAAEPGFSGELVQKYIEELISKYDIKN